MPLGVIASDHAKAKNVYTLLCQRQQGVPSATKRLRAIMHERYLENVRSQYGWGNYHTLQNGISAGDCPLFEFVLDDSISSYCEAHLTAYPPSREVVLFDSRQKVKQNFYDLLITSLDGISKTIPERIKSKLTSLELSRTNIREISPHAAAELKNFSKLQVIVLPLEATEDQQERNIERCPDISIVYLRNPEKKMLTQMRDNFQKTLAVNGNKAFPKPLSPF